MASISHATRAHKSNFLLIPILTVIPSRLSSFIAINGWSECFVEDLDNYPERNEDEQVHLSKADINQL